MPSKRETFISLPGKCLKQTRKLQNNAFVTNKPFRAQYLFVSAPLPYSLPWLPFFSRIWYTELIKSSIRWRKSKWFLFFFPLGSSPSSGLGKSSELSSGSLAPLVCLETGCQVQFHSNYSSVKIINFSSQSCPLCTTVSRYSKQRAWEFWGEIWSESQWQRL